MGDFLAFKYLISDLAVSNQILIEFLDHQSLKIAFKSQKKN